MITQSKVAGAEINMLRLCRRLIDRGHSAQVVVRPGSTLREPLRLAGVPFLEVAMHGKTNVLAPVRLAGVIRDWRPDLINTHNSTASMWGGLAARLTRTPAVAHVQGFHYSCTLWSCYGTVDTLIACSEAVRRHTMAVGFPSERVRRVYNAVEPEEFVPHRPREEVREELGLRSQDLALGTFAHLSEKKGHLDLLEAAARLPSGAPPYRLLCVGDGRLREALPRQADRLGLVPRVSFLGYRRDVADLMHAMDAMVLPSHCEPFGIVYVEAMLARLPVIACQAGGAPEVVVHGETGLLVPPHNPARLAEALAELLGSADLRRRLGAAGRRRARARFNLTRMVEETESVYRETIHNYRRPRQKAVS